MFKKAEKSKSKLRLAITSPSGGGKTYTALSIATGIGGKIAVIDTEHGSASLYADIFDFDVVEVSNPFLIKDFIKSVQEAEKAGYNVLIVDSSTHYWKTLLEHVEMLTATKYNGNSYRAWSEGTPVYDRWIQSMLSSKLHIIVTIRSKTEYAMDKNEKGKTIIAKVGMGSEQRKGIEYEFTMVMDGTVDHYFTVSKDRTGKFQDKIIEKPGVDFGAALIEWLNTGADKKEKNKEDQEKTEMLDSLRELFKLKNLKKGDIPRYTDKNINDMTITELKKLYETIETEKKPEPEKKNVTIHLPQHDYPFADEMQKSIIEKVKALFPGYTEKQLQEWILMKYAEAEMKGVKNKKEKDGYVLNEIEKQEKEGKK